MKEEEVSQSHSFQKKFLYNLREFGFITAAGAETRGQ